MRFVAWRELSDHYRKNVEGHSPWNVEDQNPQIVSLADIKVGSLGDALERVVRAEGIGALAFIPLVSQNKLIGKFMTYYPAPHCFTPPRFLFSLSSYLSLRLINPFLDADTNPPWPTIPARKGP